MSLDQRTLLNAGTAIWSDSSPPGQGPPNEILLSNGATIDNAAGATFTITNDASIVTVNQLDTATAFHNAGTLVKTGGTGETVFTNVALDNSGILRLDSGSIGFGSKTRQTLGDQRIRNPGRTTGDRAHPRFSHHR